MLFADAADQAKKNLTKLASVLTAAAIVRLENARSKSKAWEEVKSAAPKAIRANDSRGNVVVEV